MSYELSYDTYISRVASTELDSEIEENKQWKDRIEMEIFGLILSDPAKVRNQRKRSKKDDDEDEQYPWMNNPQYLTKVWEDLKEQWDEAAYKLIKCQDAKDAVERKTRKVAMCDVCHRELHSEWNKETYHSELRCPKCGKLFNSDYWCTYPDGTKPETELPDPVIAEIDTFSEG